MTLAFEREGSRLTIETTAKGMFAKLAHDLSIAASNLECEATLEAGAATLKLEIPVTSLKVDGVRKHGAVDRGVLSGSDRSDIERKLRDEVLTTPKVVVTATAKDVADDGNSSVAAELSVEASRGRAKTTSRVTVDAKPERIVVSGRAAVSLSSLSIPPVKGPLNAFRVDDKIDVVFELAFRRA